VSKLGLTLENLSSEEFEAVVRRCEMRIKSSKYPPELHILDKDSDLLSFVLAVAVVKASQREDAISRFALNEANRAETFLKTENKKTITHIIRQVLKVPVYEVEYTSGKFYYEYMIDVKEYVALSSFLKSDYWRIVNRIVDNGFVYLRRSEVLRLARDRIRQELYRRIRESPSPIIPPRLQYLVEIIRNRPLPNIPFEGTSMTGYPPCVAHALSKVERNENLAHFERFFLTSFLLKMGKNVEEIISLFSGSPDFNEKIARYQIEHIAGLRGGRKIYNVPDCRTLFSQSLCFKNDTCDDISHPLQYGKHYIRSGEKDLDRKRRLPKENL